MESYLAHSEILSSLIDEITTIDFEAIAKKELFEKSNQLKGRLKDKSYISSTMQEALSEQLETLNYKLSNFKLTQKHLVIISIDKIIELARLKSWDLCKNNGFIYLYNGAYWKTIDKEVFQKFLGKAAEKLGVDMFIAKHFLFRDQLFRQFMATNYLPSPEPPLGQVLINLQNGTFAITLEGVKLRSYNPSDFLTYQLPFNYDPNAEAPLFKSYLQKVLPDKSLQIVLAEYLGYVFVHNSSLKLEKTLLLYGSGSNGKSVFFEIISALLGTDNISHYSLQSLTDDKGYHRAKIGNKLLNYASEINGTLETAIFKQLVSGEPVEARLPYGDPFILTKYARFMFNCNELPKVVEHTHAFFRRFLIVPFEVTISEHERDTELATKIIQSELSGVMNWILEGLNRLLIQKNFSESDIAKREVETFEKESDSVQIFLEEGNYQKSIDDYMSLGLLYEGYCKYCQSNGYRTCSNRTLGSRLRRLGFESFRKGAGTYFYVSQK